MIRGLDVDWKLENKEILQARNDHAEIHCIVVVKESDNCNSTYAL